MYKTINKHNFLNKKIPKEYNRNYRVISLFGINDYGRPVALYCKLIYLDRLRPITILDLKGNTYQKCVQKLKGYFDVSLPEEIEYNATTPTQKLTEHRKSEAKYNKKKEKEAEERKKLVDNIRSLYGSIRTKPF